jgi:nucleoside 2-deoxyribosyltransferase
MPFAPDYESIKQLVVDVVHELGFESYRVETKIQVGARWANEITDAIERADLVIADVSEQNPSVMYELGYSHALRKQTILLLSTEKSGNVPFDLAGYQMLTYDPQSLEALRQQLLRAVSYALKRMDEIS